MDLIPVDVCCETCDAKYAILLDRGVHYTKKICLECGVGRVIKVWHSMPNVSFYKPHKSNKEPRTLVRSQARLWHEFFEGGIGVVDYDYTLLSSQSYWDGE